MQLIGIVIVLSLVFLIIEKFTEYQEIIIPVTIFIVAFIVFLFWKKEKYEERENLKIEKARKERESKKRSISLDQIKINNTTKRNIDGSNRQTLIRRCARYIFAGEIIFFKVKENVDITTGVTTPVIVATKIGTNTDTYIGEIGDVPDNILSVAYRHLSDVEHIFVESPVFFEDVDKKGKQIVCMALNFTMTWHDE